MSNVVEVGQKVWMSNPRVAPYLRIEGPYKLQDVVNGKCSLKPAMSKHKGLVFVNGVPLSSVFAKPEDAIAAWKAASKDDAKNKKD